MGRNDEEADIPITVIGGYLGAGKTTLLNRLLRESDGRRLGVIVNDFGSIGIDAELLAAASDTGVVNLPNGCVCCTLGNDLMETLTTLRSLPEPPDQIIIEASGIADPAAAAAWGTSAGFVPGGVVVLAAADSIRRQVDDRYVSEEVRRQLAGADLIVLTKVDLCTPVQEQMARAVLNQYAPGVVVIDTTAPSDALLGVRVGAVPADISGTHSPASYTRWSWSGGVVDAGSVAELFDALGDVLRLKALFDIGRQHLEVHVVAGRVSRHEIGGLRPGSRAEAILVADGPTSEELTAAFDALGC